MEGRDLAVQGDKELALYELETRFAMATRQRELLESYIKERLKPDKHFYTVSEGQKPSLTKEGAELICLPHALKAHYEWVSGPANPPREETPYQITMKCSFEASGKFAGEGIGSASSYITTRTGEYKPRQKDPGLCYNATVKMASKSAYIAATLNSTAASEFFTQDMEDDQTGEQTSKEDKVKYYCKEHKAVWFKRGKMTGYAHPIADSKDWCRMPSEKPKPEDQPAEPLKEATPVEKPPTDTTVKSETAPAEITGLKGAWERVTELIKLKGIDSDTFRRNRIPAICGTDVIRQINLAQVKQVIKELEGMANVEVK